VISAVINVLLVIVGMVAAALLIYIVAS